MAEDKKHYLLDIVYFLRNKKSSLINFTKYFNAILRRMLCYFYFNFIEKQLIRSDNKYYTVWFYVDL